MKEKKKKRKWFFLFWLVFFFLVFIFSIKNNKISFRRLNDLFSPLAMPFSSLAFWANEKISFIGSIGELKSENERLLKENILLKSQLVDLEEIKKENESLRKSVGLTLGKEFSQEGALVIGKDPTKNNRILINKGSADSIEEESAVVTENNILVGKVKEVSQKTAWVELLNNSEIKVSAELQKNGSRGIVKGEYDTVVVLDMIAQNILIEKGEAVITAGGNSLFPGGFLIGYVREVLSSSDHLFQKAILDLPIDYNQVRFVWIVKKRNEVD